MLSKHKTKIQFEFIWKQGKLFMVAYLVSCFISFCKYQIYPKPLNKPLTGIITIPPLPLHTTAPGHQAPYLVNHTNNTDIILLYYVIFSIRTDQ